MGDDLPSKQKHMATKWSQKIQFPTDSNYTNRVLSAAYGPSKSSGNPMITLECEVVTPQEVEVGTEVVSIAGVKTWNYFTAQILNGDGTVDTAQSADKEKQIKELYAKFELPTEGLDFNNLDVTGFKGKLALTQMTSEVDEQRKDPTLAQVEEAKKLGKRAEGTVMKHPVTGKPLISYKPRIVEFFGVVSGAAVGGASY